jgi:hypothetical protein
VTDGRYGQVAGLGMGRVVWCAGRMGVALDRGSGRQRVMTGHRAEITCLAAGVGGEDGGLVATADRLGAAGVWRGGLAAALVWSGLTGRVVGCVPATDGDDRLGPVVALCFCPGAALKGDSGRGDRVGLVAVTCDGAAGYGLRVYSMPRPADGPEMGGRGGGRQDRSDSDGPAVAVASLCWTGWARCRMVRAVAAAAAAGTAGSGALRLVTAGKRHVRCDAWRGGGSWRTRPALGGGLRVWGPPRG